MKAAPLIHSRTFRCDYLSDFAVRPEDFSSADVQAARKKILISTRDVDMLPELRHLVFSLNEQYVVAGVSGSMKKLAQLASGGDAVAQEEQLFSDEAGRGIFAFVGLVFHKSEGYEKRQVDDTTLWGMFQKFMSPVWMNRVVEAQKAAYEDVDLPMHTQEAPSVKSMGQNIRGIELYESGYDSDIQRFDEYFARAFSEKNVSFCSNLENKSDILEGEFSVASATKSRIVQVQQKVKEEDDAKKRRAPTSRPNTLKEADRPVQDQKKKKSPFRSLWIVCAAVLVILILLMAKNIIK